MGAHANAVDIEAYDWQSSFAILEHRRRVLFHDTLIRSL